LAAITLSAAMDESLLSITHSGAAHPDCDWIRQVRGALDRWEATAPATPTSSVLGGGAIAAAEDAFSSLIGGRPAVPCQLKVLGAPH
jgi:hypothetical protein